MGKGQAVRDEQQTVHCSRCNQWKPREEFNWRDKKNQKLQYVCRSCQTEQGRNRYINHKDRVKQVNKTARIIGQQRNRSYAYNLLQNARCADCGIDDPRVLTFDHVRGKKKTNISDMIGKAVSIETLDAEIAKCEIVCHNCHAIRTQKRSGFFKGWLPFLRKS